jgi:serine/threonine protein phosphatase PrpC
MESNGIGSVQFEIVALTHRGAIRPRNEDAILVGESMLLGESEAPIVERFVSESPVVMVADGMGGHTHGAIASRSALKVVKSAAKDAVGERIILDALTNANDALYDLMRSQPELTGMGTTIVGAVFLEAAILHFNVGDSRVYRHRHGTLVLLSHDDVPLPSSGPKARRSSHLITQSLGGDLAVVRSIHTLDTPSLFNGVKVSCFAATV